MAISLTILKPPRFCIPTLPRKMSSTLIIQFRYNLYVNVEFKYENLLQAGKETKETGAMVPNTTFELSKHSNLTIQ